MFYIKSTRENVQIKFLIFLCDYSLLELQLMSLGMPLVSCITSVSMVNSCGSRISFWGAGPLWGRHGRFLAEAYAKAKEFGAVGGGGVPLMVKNTKGPSLFGRTTEQVRP